MSTSFFADTLAPMGLETFMEKFWDRTFLHQASDPGQFDRLFSWDLLSETLNTHRLLMSRFRLFRSGVQVPPRSYQLAGDDGLEPRTVLRLLQSGCTIALDRAEAISAPLADLIEDMEERLCSPVHANMYAAWGTDNGFPIHYDLQDTLILNVSGSKHWKVWEPTTLHPVKPDGGLGRPTGTPVWDGQLVSGSLLYMPRGWWHLATPVGVPCLHLTVTVPNHNGIDFVRWAADQLQGSQVARRNVPLWADEATQQQYLGELFAALQESWHGDASERFRQHAIGKRRPRPSFRFPALD